MPQAPVIYRRAEPVPLSADGTDVRLGTNLFATGVLSPDRTSRLSVLGLDGAGIFNDRFIASVPDAIAALDGVAAADLPRLGGEMRGSLALYVYDALTETVLVLIDPLGGNLTFLHEHAGFVAVSSHIEALAPTVRRTGRPVNKSLAYALSQIATGMYGGVIDSSYEDISGLPIGTFITIDADGHALRSYDEGRDVDYGAIGWEEGIERTRAEIIANVRIAAAHPAPRRISHLTGGLDSRTVLGALLASGHANQFALNTRGPLHSADQLVARQLAATYGLTMTRFLGLTEAISPTSREEYLLKALRFSGGLAATPTHGDMLPNGTLTLSGGYGEFYRSYSTAADFIDSPTSPRDGALAKWGSYAFGPDPNEVLFTDDVVDRFLTPIEESMRFSRERGLAPDTWIDVFYRRHRNRFFVGEISRAWSRHAPRFDPLYSVFATRFGIRQGFHSRVAGLFQVDLMRSLDPDLLAYPYDSQRFSPLFRELRGDPEERPFAAGLPAPRFNGWTNPNPLSSGRRYNPAHEVSGRDLSTARRQQLSPTTAAEVRVASANVSRLLGDLDGTEIDRVIHRPVVEKIQARALHHAWSRRALLTIERGLLWYAE